MLIGKMGIIIIISSVSSSLSWTEDNIKKSFISHKAPHNLKVIIVRVISN